MTTSEPDDDSVIDACRKKPVAEAEHVMANMTLTDPVISKGVRFPLIERLDHAHLRLMQDELRVQKQSDELHLIEARVQELERRVQSSEEAQTSHTEIRNRFLSVFRRDILRNETARDRAIINASEHAARYGHAVADAALYEKNVRFDGTTYRELYGLGWQDALRYRQSVRYHISMDH